MCVCVLRVVCVCVCVCVCECVRARLRVYVRVCEFLRKEQLGREPPVGEGTARSS